MLQYSESTIMTKYADQLTNIGFLASLLVRERRRSGAARVPPATVNFNKFGPSTFSRGGPALAVPWTARLDSDLFVR